MWHRYSLKLGALGEAAEAAFVLRDIEALSRSVILHAYFFNLRSGSTAYLLRVESLAGGDSHLLDKVAGFKARLHAGMR